MTFRDDSLSPDPLALSLDRATDRKPDDTMLSPRPVTPMRNKKSNNSSVQLQDFYLTTPQAALLRTSSPTRSMAETENILSPWKIRVRVEAEKSDTHPPLKQLSPSPIPQVGQWTRTTTIPLKGADESAFPTGKKPRGRPRKSMDGPIKRNGTPKPMRSVKEKETLIDKDDQQEVGVEQGTPSKGHKTHPKKNPEPETAPKKRGRPKGSKNVQSASAAGKTRAGKKTTTFAEKPGHTKTNHTSQGTDGTSLQGREQLSPTIWNQRVGEPTKDVPISPSQALKRKREVRMENSLSEQFNPMINDSQKPGVSSLNPEDAEGYLKAQRENFKISHRNIDSLNRHGEFDSIIESEGFSMVTVSTLPSAKQIFAVSPVGEVKSGIRESDSESHISETQNAQLLKRKEKISRTALNSSGKAPLISTEPNLGGVSRIESVSREGAASLRSMSSGTHQRERSDFNSVLPTKEYMLPSMPLSLISSPSRRSSGLVDLRIDGSTDTPQLLPSTKRVYHYRSAPQGEIESLQALSSLSTDMERNAQNNTVRDSGLRLREFGLGARRYSRDSLQLSMEHESQSPGFMNTCSQEPGSQLPSNAPNFKLSEFGTGTRGELTAGLRFGKESTKWQRMTKIKSLEETCRVNDGSSDLGTVNDPKLPTPSESDIASQSHKHGDVIYPEISTNHRQHVNEVRYPSLPPNQLLSPERSNDLDESELESDVEAPLVNSDYENQVSWKANIVKSNESVAAEIGTLPSPQTRKRGYERDWARREAVRQREREAEWQREREAILRQIQQANQSQVIVIDNSTIADRSKAHENDEGVGEDEVVKGQILEDEDLDIWQTEANNARKLAKEPRHNITTDAPEVLFLKTHIRPRRSKLPSPWRRQSSSNITYNDEHALSDPDPFFPSPEKKGPETPLQSRKRNFVLDDMTNFSDLSDFGRPEDECTTVQFKRPRLVHSVEDKIPMAMEEKETPNCENSLETVQENLSGETNLDRASQLHGSSPSILRQRHASIVIAGAKQSSTVDSAAGSKGHREPSIPALQPQSEAMHGFRHSAQDTTQASTQAPTQPPILSSSHHHSQPSILPSDRTRSTSFQAHTTSAKPSPQARIQHSTQSSIQLRISPFEQPSTPPVPATHSPTLTPIKPILSRFLPASLPFAISPVGSQPVASTPSSPTPLTLHHPWTNAHYLVLQPLYLKERFQHYHPPYRPKSSPSSFLLGKTVRSHGWSKTIESWELGVVDAFMTILLEKGVTVKVEKPRSLGWWGAFKETIDIFVGRQGIRSWEELSKVDAIDEVEVIKRVFSLWVGRVQRGEEDLGDGVAGYFDERYKVREGLIKGWA